MNEDLIVCSSKVKINKIYKELEVKKSAANSIVSEIGSLNNNLAYEERVHTLEEIADVFGVTREKIRQKEQKAIKKIEAQYILK